MQALLWEDWLSQTFDTVGKIELGDHATYAIPDL